MVERRFFRIFLVLTVPLMLMACSSSSKQATGMPPKPPTDLKTQVVAQGVEISWASVQGATHYTIFWGSNPRDYKFMGNSNDAAVLLASIQKEKMYYVAVTAWNQFGESVYSGEQSFVYDDQLQNSAKHVAKGEELLQKGYYHDAKAYFSAAIACDPENAEAYQRRALVHENLSLVDSAKKDYAKAESIYKKKMSNTDPTRGAFVNN